MADDDEQVKLISKDEQEFTMERETAEISEFVRTATEDGDVTEVNVLRVNGATLEKVVKFLNHYKEDKMNEIPTPLGGSSFDEIVTQDWYRDFLKDEERDVVFDLLTAANYMGIKPLLDLTCLKVTFELTGKSAEEIRVILNLPKLTPEEEKRAREEHKWIFEDA